MKTCTDCGDTKPLADFPRRSSATDGRQSYCGSCNSARTRRWCKANPERTAAYHRARRLRRYGLTPEMFAALTEAQSGRCAVCRTAEPGGRHGQWHVDHDHSCCPGVQTCGRCVRGLLCNDCNTRLLPVLEDAKMRALGMAYLENPPAKRLWGNDVPRQEPQ